MELGKVGAGGDAGIDGIERDRRGLSVHQDGSVVFSRRHGLADFALDTSTGTATIDVYEAAPPGMEDVLAAGLALAMGPALRGQPCLHASAVSIGGQAVAFAAPSGGRSTLAALACLAGADLVADDILARALGDGSEVRCLPGSRERWSRPATAEPLAGAAWPRPTTADGSVLALEEHLSGVR